MMVNNCRKLKNREVIRAGDFCRLNGGSLVPVEASIGHTVEEWKIRLRGGPGVSTSDNREFFRPILSI